MPTATITELYEFQLDGVYYTYTPKILPVTFGGKIYEPSVITRTAIILTDNFLRNTLNVTFPRTNTFSRLLLKNIPESPVKLTLYRDGIVIWKGFIVSATGNGLFITLDCVTGYSKTTRPALTAKIQIACRHILYSASCGAIKDSLGIALNISAVDSSKTILTFNGITQLPGYFLNGEVLWNGMRRNIVDHSGTNIRITYPFGLTPAGTAILYPGCDHTKTTCLTKFNNVVNYGGFTHLPGRNPHDGTAIIEKG